MNPREFVTEILNEAQQRDVLDPIVRFLSSKGVESVRLWQTRFYRMAINRRYTHHSGSGRSQTVFLGCQT